MIIIDGKDYQIGTLSTQDAFNLARKLSRATGIIDALLDPDNEGKDRTMLMLMAFGALDDATSKAAIDLCMKAVTVHQEAVWARIVDPTGNLMFSDIGVSTMMILAIKVIEENLGDFFRTALGAIR